MRTRCHPVDPEGAVPAADRHTTNSGCLVMTTTSSLPARLLLGAGLVALVGCGAPERGAAPGPGAGPASSNAGEASSVAVLHASADCQCCGGHAEHLLEHGYRVEEVRYDDPAELAAFKDAHGIPYEQRSCHTTLVGGYVVEGHMPVEEIDALLAERPAIDGIALAGMPAGSPGMPGIKSIDWTIWALDDGEAFVHVVR
jgi:hypothetical protein